MRLVEGKVGFYDGRGTFRSAQLLQPLFASSERFSGTVYWLGEQPLTSFVLGVAGN